MHLRNECRWMDGGDGWLGEYDWWWCSPVYRAICHDMSSIINCKSSHTFQQSVFTMDVIWVDDDSLQATHQYWHDMSAIINFKWNQIFQQSAFLILGINIQTPKKWFSMMSQTSQLYMKVNMKNYLTILVMPMHTNITVIYIDQSN